MADKRYGWNGWKMPILHPNDPEYCEYGCPICTNARQGHPVYRRLQRVELALLPRGCWWGRARRRKYGVSPDQPLTAERKKAA